MCSSGLSIRSPYGCETRGVYSDEVGRQEFVVGVCVAVRQRVPHARLEIDEELDTVLVPTVSIAAIPSGAVGGPFGVLSDRHGDMAG